MGKLVFNERLKLRANFANNVGIALLISIAIAPMVATDHGLPLWQEVLLVLFGFAVALSCHIVGASFLKGLRED